MLTDSPTSLQIGLTPDIPCVAKIRRPQWHVPKSIKRIFRALAPEPYPFEGSGYVPQGMEHELGLNRQQVCWPNERELRPEIRSSRKKRIQGSEGTRLSIVSAYGIGLEAESHGPHRSGKRPPEIPSCAPGANLTIPEGAPLEPSLNVVIKTCSGWLAG